VRIGLDATYALDPQPTGVAVYSRELIRGITAAEPATALYYRWHRFRRLDRSWMAAAAHRLLIDAFAPGVEIFHGLNQRLPRRKRGRFVATFHDLFVMTAAYSDAGFRARFTRQAREAAERADAVIAVSEFTASEVTDLLGVEPARISVVPHGVHAATRSAGSEPIILHVGAIQTRKNLSRLVEAFEKTPPGWRLVLAGGDGYGAEAVHQRIADSPRRADIETTGYVDPAALESLYQRASMVAFPSLDEGFGLPVLEAMARGLPVVTSNRSATKEVAGTAAILVDPENVDELAGALSSLAGDRGLRAERSEAGLARAAGFTWTQAVELTRKVYRKVA
jgi:glycosyltransferase involved in cell wall biosynthesis